MLMNFGMKFKWTNKKTYSCSPSWSAFLAAGLWFILIDIYGNSLTIASKTINIDMIFFIIQQNMCVCVCDQQQSDLNQLTSLLNTNEIIVGSGVVMVPQF